MSSELMRDIINALNEASKDEPYRLENPINDPHVSYDYAGSTKAKTAAGEYSKVTATVTHDLSGVYTRLAKKFKEIDELNKQMQAIRDEANDIAKGKIEDLFSANDALLTRYIDTKSLVITMSKDQEEQRSEVETFDKEGFVAGLFELLSEDMQPEIEKLLKLNTKITTKVRAAQKGRVGVKLKEATIFDKIKEYGKRIYNVVIRKMNKYDQKLAKLKKDTGVT